MIDCLYCGSYDEFNLSPDSSIPNTSCQPSVNVDAQSWKSPHQLHAAMYALGDKYDLAVIKDTAKLKYVSQMAKYGIKDLLNFIESIPIVYSSTSDSDRQLRDAAVQKTLRHPEHFLQPRVKPKFQKILVEVPEFSWDLHQSWMNPR